MPSSAAESAVWEPARDAERRLGLANVSDRLLFRIARHKVQVPLAHRYMAIAIIVAFRLPIPVSREMEPIVGEASPGTQSD